MGPINVHVHARKQVLYESFIYDTGRKHLEWQVNYKIHLSSDCVSWSVHPSYPFLPVCTPLGVGILLTGWTVNIRKIFNFYYQWETLIGQYGQWWIHSGPNETFTYNNFWRKFITPFLFIRFGFLLSLQDFLISFFLRLNFPWLTLWFCRTS